MEPKKLKIYLDTTLPNYVFNDHTPEKQQIAKKLFQEISEDKFTAFISQVVADEIADATEPKRTTMLDLIANIPLLPLIPECRELAENYITRGIIPSSNKEDALHIAIATVHNMDVIVSYNFEHIVRLKTIKEVTAVNLIYGYKIPDIVFPEEVI